jgi:para-nitrobenzyl esterase
MGDVPYFLGSYDAFNLFRTTRDWTAWDRELSSAMQDVVIAFARTGNPSTKAAPFTRYAPGDETRVDFGNAITVEKLNTKGMDFIEKTPAEGGGRGGRGRRGGG